MVNVSMKGKKLFQRVLSLILAVIMMPSASVFALTEEELEMFAQNDILFYEPDSTSTTCELTPTDVYKGVQYDLTEEEIRGFARAAQAENNCNLNAIKSELSVIANLYERNGANYSGIIDYFKNGGWWAASTVAKFDDSSVSVSEEYVNAAKDVLVNGNRILPAQVVEHDCVGDLDWIEVDGVRYNGSNAGECKGTGLSDKSLYKRGKTKIHNTYGSTYIFYQWAGGSDGCGDPFGYFEGSEPADSYSTVTATNVNYAGVQVFTDSEMQAIEANQAIYEEAANKYNFPWQILAVLHKREAGLRRYNPDNGQGVYQLYSYTGGGTNENRFPPAESISEEEFRRQTLIAAEFVTGMVGGADLNDTGNIKRLFFQYNGVASVYVEKAINMGFSEQEARNGEGSTYVMNRYDARRDPTSDSMSRYWPGRYVGDGVYDPTSVEYNFGAFVQYEALAGLGSRCSSSSIGEKIAETAVSISWLGKGSHSINDPKPEYVTAMKESGAYLLPCGGNGDCPPYGASCDQFVATALRYSGADPNFPVFFGHGIPDYLKSHTELYMEVDHHNDITRLLPGDIFVTYSHGDNHIYLYVGMIDGEPYQASASWGGRTGEHYPGVYFTEGSRVYSVYRRMNK